MDTYYACVDCGTKGSFHGDPFLNKNNTLKIFDNWIDINELEKIHIFKHDNKARYIISNIFKNEVTAVIGKLEGLCPSCGVVIYLDVWIKFHVEDKEDNMVLLSIENKIVLDGNKLKVESIPGFYRGVDIAEGLHKLYLRWWFLNGDIYIFCPFIDAGYQYFDEIGNDILITYNCMLASEKHRQPFKKVVTRRHLSYNDKADDKIEEFINNTYRNVEYLHGSPGSGLTFLLKDNFYGVENISPKDKSPENYKTYFHAKMYGSTTPYGMAEMVITSYNYIAYEVMQLESVSFAEVDSDTFMRQVYKFQDDPHMLITQIDFSDI